MKPDISLQGFAVLKTHKERQMKKLTIDLLSPQSGFLSREKKSRDIKIFFSDKTENHVFADVHC